MNDIISSYTRQDAIDDGMFDDVTETAKEAGFNCPVAITCGVAELCDPKDYAGQDYDGRLWDVLWMAINAARRATEQQKADELIPYEVIFAFEHNRRRTEKLWLCFSSSEGFTIMKPEEY